MKALARVEEPVPTAKPTLLYDGECGFCRRWINRWRRRVRERVDFLPWQSTLDRFPQVEAETAKGSAVFVDEGGAVRSGALAIFSTLARAPLGNVPLSLYQRVPPFAQLSERAYRAIADHRMLLGKTTRWLFGANEEAKSWRISRSLFLRALGVIFLIAFASLASQADGLLGSRGISPVGEFLGELTSQYGPDIKSQVPTLFWMGASDAAIHRLIAAGIGLSIALVVGIAPPLTLFLLWMLYLSIAAVGGVFLGYQWDALLLETSFLAILLGPSFPFLSLARSDPPRVSRWLLRFLLFRLMWLSGRVKLASGDPAWASLTALQYHYWTQPLPVWTSWYAAHLPDWFQSFSCRLMFLIELKVPFLLFGPRQLRHLAAALLAFLQVAILATGNYGFFNLLALALLIPQLDDQAWLALVPRPLRRALIAPLPSQDFLPMAGRFALRLALLPVALTLLVAAWYQTRSRGSVEPPPPAVGTLLRAIGPYQSVNTYGLFSVMTTSRPEIELSGSADGKEWRPYLFKWKPGPLDRAPRFVAPHQPRLDWQMWFAALESCRENPWILRFQERLLQGDPAVSGLLASDPFPGAPPRYLRTTVWQYRFTTSAEKKESGNWWKREPDPEQPEYCPPLTLDRKGELSQATLP